MSAITIEQNQPLVTLTAAAAQRVLTLIKEEGNYNLKFRVYITGGGCSGFQYGFGFDDKLRPDDMVSSIDVKEVPDQKVNIVVDALSIMYLTGAEIDYVENLQGAHFTVKNPNALTSCSCGSSFAI